MSKKMKKMLILELFKLRKCIEGSMIVDFGTNYSECDMKLIDELESAAFRLKTIDNDRLFKTQELKEKGETSYSIDFWNDELRQKYRLFIIILGIIDKKISEINDESKIDNLIKFRNELISQYNSFNTVKNIQKLDNAIKSYPVVVLMNDTTEDLCNDFYEFYKLGRILSKDINLKLAIDSYNTLVANLNNTRNEKNIKINVKTK